MRRSCILIESSQRHGEVPSGKIDPHSPHQAWEVALNNPQAISYAPAPTDQNGSRDRSADATQ